jgi:hypothetical protein
MRKEGRPRREQRICEGRHRLVNQCRYLCHLIGLRKSKSGCDLDRWNHRSLKIKSASSWNNCTAARITYLAKQRAIIRVHERWSTILVDPLCGNVVSLLAFGDWQPLLTNTKGTRYSLYSGMAVTKRSKRYPSLKARCSHLDTKSTGISKSTGALSNGPGYTDK